MSTAEPNPRKKIHCQKDFGITGHNFRLNISILEKLKITFGIEPRPVGEATQWINAQLAELLALCEAYKASDETTFSTQAYVAEIDRVAAWQTQFINAISAFQTAVATLPKQNGHPTADQPTKDALSTTLTDLLEQMEIGMTSPPKTAKGISAPSTRRELNATTFSKPFDLNVSSSPTTSILQALYDHL